jgi:hypothetical protein
MHVRKYLIGCLIFIALERFCYFQTGTFSLSKMIYEKSPPSPTSISSTVELTQPLTFIGAGKQFYAFETQDKKYVVKFMKWSRRRPLPWLEKIPALSSYKKKRSTRAPFILNSCQIALQNLLHETQLVIPKPQTQLTLIDKLGISHTIDSSSTHFYVQQKAVSFSDAYQKGKSEVLIRSFIHTVSMQCRRGIRNLDPVIGRNYGVVENQIILLDIGSFKKSPELCHKAAITQEIVLELLPLRAFLQEKDPDQVKIFDMLLAKELK